MTSRKPTPIRSGRNPGHVEKRKTEGDLSDGSQSRAKKENTQELRDRWRPGSSQLPTPRTRTEEMYGSLHGTQCNPVYKEGIEQVLEENFAGNAAWVFLTTYTFWAWYLILIAVGKWIIPIICQVFNNMIHAPSGDPLIPPEQEWTAVHAFHTLITFLTFHWNKGNGVGINAFFRDYDELTFWEQLDNGQQYTPSRKFFMLVPIVIFLAASWCSGWDKTTLWINLFVLCLSLVPKLPAMHGVRLRIPPGTRRWSNREYAFGTFRSVRG